MQLLNDTIQERMKSAVISHYLCS